jgi:hypothetical protein
MNDRPNNGPDGASAAHMDRPVAETPQGSLRAAPTWSPRASQDPRDVFLDAKAVMRRYGWGKTKGYQNLKNRDLVPPPVMTHPDRWRLDQLLAWEDRRIASELIDLITPTRPSLESQLPAPKRSRRKSA